LEGLTMEDVGIFYWHLVHFTVFCYILWTVGIVRGNLVYFGILYQEKSGNHAFSHSHLNVADNILSNKLNLKKIENWQSFWKLCPTSRYIFVQLILLPVCQNLSKIKCSIICKNQWFGQMWHFVLCQEWSQEWWC
jgi:hypothetical protein